MRLAKKPDEKKHKFQIITAYPDNRIRLEIRQEQCGCVRNVVFIIRMLSEQTIDKVEHLYFID